MLVDRSNDKLENAITYFVGNTRYCGKTKLYKLLYFLDFAHYSTTGRSVTDLDYFAWPKGPVPVKVHAAIDDANSSLHDSFTITNTSSYSGHSMLRIVPKFAFDKTVFSKRELKLLQKFAAQYSDSRADDMVEATHLENLPWDKIYNKLGQKQKHIPYELALKNSELSEMNHLISEYREFGENYK